MLTHQHCNAWCICIVKPPQIQMNSSPLIFWTTISVVFVDTDTRTGEIVRKLYLDQNEWPMSVFSSCLTPITFTLHSHYIHQLKYRCTLSHQSFSRRYSLMATTMMTMFSVFNTVFGTSTDRSAVNNCNIECKSYLYSLG